MDKRILTQGEYATAMAMSDDITGYHVVKVYREEEFAIAQRESDGRYGYLWLWTSNLDFTPMDW